MAGPSQDEITQLLVAWGKGDRAALDRLMPIVHAELRRLAHGSMRREPAGHILQTSALVNEAYLKLVNERAVCWQDRAHFFAVAAQMMRRILVDFARARNAAKRGGGAIRVSLDEAAAASEQRAADLVALDEALERLARIDERRSRVTEYRYFAGLSVEETATVLGVSPDTVVRDWRLARAWLRRELDAGAEHGA
jgi:RNA polymerase sigma-70 factor (ECF subfamily)